MKKTILLVALILLLVISGYLLFHATQQGTPVKTYPFTLTLADKSRQQVQIYQGSWVNTGGSASDSTGKIQVTKNGKTVDFPMTIQQQTDANGTVSFMLPAGKYFVYIPNPVYEDELPRDITIPNDTHLAVSGDRH